MVITLIQEHVRHVLKDVPHAVLVLLVQLTKLAISTFVTLRLTVPAKLQTAFSDPELIARLALLVALNVRVQALQVAKIASQNMDSLQILAQHVVFLIVTYVMALFQLAQIANQVMA